MKATNNYFDIPILFITYNKFDTTINVLNKIKILNPSKLIIASDGPKNSEDNKIITNLRHHLKKSLNISTSPKFIIKKIEVQMVCNKCNQRIF